MYVFYVGLKIVFFIPVDIIDGRNDHADCANAGQIDGKLAKGEVGVRADEDIGWVSDQGRRAPHIGGENFGDQEGNRVDLQG